MAIKMNNDYSKFHEKIYMHPRLVAVSDIHIVFKTMINDSSDIVIFGLLPFCQTSHNQCVDTVEGEADNNDHYEWD